MAARDKFRREILPIPDIQHVGLTTYDAKDPDTRYPPIEPLRPPKGAPNVLIVLIDDVGFGTSSAFGGHWLELDVDKEALDQDHFLAPEERFHVAMALQ